jgi:hypothetical protein
MKDRAKQDSITADGKETALAKQRRLRDMESNEDYVAHRLFLTETELRWTEISNKIDDLGEHGVIKKSSNDEEMLAQWETDNMKEIYGDGEEDIDDEDIVLG